MTISNYGLLTAAVAVFLCSQLIDFSSDDLLDQFRISKIVHSFIPKDKKANIFGNDHIFNY